MPEKSTVWTTALPGAPVVQPRHRAHATHDNIVTLNGLEVAQRLESTVLPTLAPQPPQRMATAGWPGKPLRHSVPQTYLAEGESSIAGRSVNFSMKRRSMRSFQRHTQLQEAVVATGSYRKLVTGADKDQPFRLGRNGFGVFPGPAA